eukprot:TRINITY_DN3195_c0_g1_i1.p1 TRINITY_DN3195_c0_g1~~TRINITY_DN3195_c0_g1_i1.p1  ORF type:complete len:836 (-),score=200.33 TRINITY_DN3195_c0_g1_i1:69-2555(-)
MVARFLALIIPLLLQLFLQSNGELYRVTVLDSPITETTWVGKDDQVVFTVTQEGHLWRSTDGGLTWIDQTAAGELDGALEKPPHRGLYDPPPGVQAILLSDAAENKMLLRGADETHWVSSDRGKSYTRIKGPAGHLGLVTIRFHPDESDWILVIARRWLCWEPDDAHRKHCADDLFVTKDFGRSWTNLTEKAQGNIISFVDFDWGWSKSPNAPKHPSTYRKDTILAAVFENRNDVRKHLDENGFNVAVGWDQFVDFIRTDDMFRSGHIKTVSCGNQFEILEDKLFLAVADKCGQRASVTNFASEGVKLKVSFDYGATFRDTCFPIPLTEKGYSVVAVSDSSAFINVDYAQGRRASPYGNVLVSDNNFTLFTLSMRRNARSMGGAVDFAAVQGIPGMYIANQIEDDDNKEPQRAEAQAGTMEDEEMIYSLASTMITYNGGASWQPIEPPRYDAFGHPTTCKRQHGCSLHLHGATSWVGSAGFAFVYSHKSTPGLVISTGNLGRFLYEDSTVNTYLSRDAGQTWEEIEKGSHIYEFGDSGGVIVLADHGFQQATNEVKYSLDEGLSWKTIQFRDEGSKIDVVNVRVEPDNMGRKFIIQGLTVEKESVAERKGVIVTLNFEGTGDFKECGPSDYEMWSPTETRCMLGQNFTLERQRRTSKCWNGERYQRPEMKAQPCKCTQEDYECDFGSESVTAHDGTRSCLPIPHFYTSSCPTISSGSYSLASTRHRLVAGDRCTGFIMKSGYYHSPRTFGWFVRWFVILLLGGAIISIAVAGAAYVGYSGILPEDLLSRIPFMDRIRYRHLRSNFESLSQDLGLGGGDDDYEEMYRRP